jgi:DNA-binding transcriptional regulator LsrR (DeoR family)
MSKQPANRSERNDEICRLYGAGVKQEAIALQFGISQPMVCKILGRAPKFQL